MSFAVNMNNLFEEYVRRAFYAAFHGRVTMQENKRQFDVTGIDRPMKVDLLLRGADATCVGDCKNKLVSKMDQVAFSEAELKHSDIYQVVAYAAHEAIRASSAFLVYPIVAPDGQGMHLATEIRCFANDCGMLLPVRIFLLNLAPTFFQVVQSLRSHEATFFPQKLTTNERN